MMTDPGFVDEEHKTVSPSGVFVYTRKQKGRSRI